MTSEPPKGEQPIDSLRRDADAAQQQWLHARSYLNKHRYSLSHTAQDLYPLSWRVAGTPLLASPRWLPAKPLPLDQVQLSWCVDQVERGISGTGSESESVRPLRPEGGRFSSYAEALAVLSRPSLFQNRRCYRVFDVNVSSSSADLAFCDGSYFDIINVCEATAHEYAAVVLAAQAGDGEPIHRNDLPLRSLVGDPTDLRRRPVIPAISTLTLRADHGLTDVQMILHWRDPAKVASGGGLYQVAPVGIFQPSNDAPWNWENDFSLGRAIGREMSEELLGSEEAYGSDVQPIDYDRWPFFQALEAARRDGALRVYWLGLGIDPLTLVADMLTVAVFDSAVFDGIFTKLVGANEEGQIVASPLPNRATVGLPFDSDTVERFVNIEPIQPAGAALLRLAWAYRSELLAT